MSIYEVTEKDVYLTKTDGTLKAQVSATVAGVHVIKGIRVVEGNRGTFVSMPSVKNKTYDPKIKGSKEWYDEHFPITTEAHHELVTAVLAAYQAKLQSTSEAK